LNKPFAGPILAVACVPEQLADTSIGHVQRVGYRGGDYASLVQLEYLHAKGIRCRASPLRRGLLGTRLLQR
jgi:hypothetical protein